MGSAGAFPESGTVRVFDRKRFDVWSSIPTMTLGQGMTSKDISFF